MTRLLHIGSSPRGAASESLQIADAFLDSYRQSNPDAEIETWDLWDGSLPAFGPPAAAAKMIVFGGGTPQGEQADAWRAAQATFARFDAADRLLSSVPMWNAGIPYILKQLIDVISQPAMVFGIDPDTGYTHLLEGRGKKAAVIYTAPSGAHRSDPSSAATSNRRTSTTGCAGRGSPTSPRFATTRPSPAAAMGNDGRPTPPHVTRPKHSE